MIADLILKFVVQVRIADHLKMSRKNGPALFAKLLSDRIAVSFNLAPNGGNCSVEALELIIDNVARNETARDAESLVINYQRFANGDAR